MKGISALKKDHVYGKIIKYTAEDTGLGVINDPDFIDATVSVMSHWLNDLMRQSWIRKLQECQKNNDMQGASEIKKLKEAWLLSFAILYERRDPTSYSFMNTTTSTTTYCDKRYKQ